MPEILELPQLVEQDGVPRDEGRARRVEPFLDSQRRAAAELGGQLGLDQELGGAAAKDSELLWDVDFHLG